MKYVEDTHDEYRLVDDTHIFSMDHFMEYKWDNTGIRKHY